MLFVQAVFLLSLLEASYQTGNKFVVKTAKGKIRGCLRDIGFYGRKVQHYFGVPYARAPVGDLRWRAPVPADPWTGTIDGCKFYPNECPQTISSVRGVQSEDCLFLSITTPEHTTPKCGLPVLVYIHGGGFIMGSSNFIDVSYLTASTDVIVVTLNYRLGVLGYLPFPGTSSKGNYGMLDQLAALRWIKENIRHFGGNPNHVTISGISAGGVSVSLLTVSPLAKGLFQRAISMSGAATAEWVGAVFDHDNYVRNFSAEVGCTGKRMDDVLKCMRTKGVKKLLEVQGRVAETWFSNLTTPCVDGEFLPQHPRKLLQQGKILPVDQMIGLVRDEATLFISSRNYSYKSLHEVADLYLPNDQHFPDIREAVVQQYTPYGSGFQLDTWRTAFANFLSDFMFNAAADFTARRVAESGNKVFFYVFAYETRNSVYPKWLGVQHAADNNYVFGAPFNTTINLWKSPSAYTEMEKGLSLEMMKMWGNFVKKGNPSVAEEGIIWPRFDTKNAAYLEIKMSPEVKTALDTARLAFWNQYVPKLRKLEKSVE